MGQSVLSISIFPFRRNRGSRFRTRITPGISVGITVAIQHRGLNLSHCRASDFCKMHEGAGRPDRAFISQRLVEPGGYLHSELDYDLKRWHNSSAVVSLRARSE
jgi:hypothetical protein